VAGARRRPLSPQAILHVALEILAGLAYAHSRRSPTGEPLGIIHRDLSPSNILCSGEGEVKLSDFGIAKAVTYSSVFYRVRGKVGYMSPEMARNQPIDARSDLFSLGVSIYETLIGERIYTGDLNTPPDKIYAQTVPSLEAKCPGLPPGLQGVLDRALAIDPAERFSDAEAFATALRQVAHAHRLLYSAPELAAELREIMGPIRKTGCPSSATRPICAACVRPRRWGPVMKRIPWSSQARRFRPATIRTSKMWRRRRSGSRLAAHGKQSLVGEDGSGDGEVVGADSRARKSDAEPDANEPDASHAAAACVHATPCPRARFLSRAAPQARLPFGFPRFHLSETKRWSGRDQAFAAQAVAARSARARRACSDSYSFASSSGRQIRVQIAASAVRTLASRPDPFPKVCHGWRDGIDHPADPQGRGDLSPVRARAVHRDSRSRSGRVPGRGTKPHHAGVRIGKRRAPIRPDHLAAAPVRHPCPKRCHRA
jgi:hypothetical protein